MSGDGPLPVADRGFSRKLSFGGCGLPALGGAAFMACLVLAGGALAEDVPDPRISPLRTDSPLSEEALLATGAAPPSFAEEDFESVQPLAAFGASTPRDLVQMVLDGESTGEPMSLAPQAQAANPFAEQAPLTGAPIDLSAPGIGGTDFDADDQAILGSYTLDARLIPDGPPLESGVTWRVYADDGTDDEKMRLVGEADGGPVTLRLKPGEYYVHAAFGRAGLTHKVTVAPTPRGESLVLDAGGIRLAALAGKDRAIAPEEIRFDIYAPDEGGSDGRVTVMENAPAGTVIGLNAGTYHVVCRYGDANAIVRADIRVEAGKLTEATVYQQAARVTLKLVENHGGEALANTQWSVVTASGESVVESVGAFPSVVLSEGEYTAIAKHEDRIFEQKFVVEPGLNRDVEVLQQ